MQENKGSAKNNTKDKDSVGKIQEGCSGLQGETPGAFPKAGPIFQQPSSFYSVLSSLVSSATTMP